MMSQWLTACHERASQLAVFSLRKDCTKEDVQRDAVVPANGIRQMLQLKPCTEKFRFFYWKAHWPQKAQWRSESLAQPHRETHLALLIPSLPNGLQRRRWVPFNQLVHSIVPLLHPAPFMMDGGINKKEMVHICIWFASPNENDIN